MSHRFAPRLAAVLLGASLIAAAAPGLAHPRPERRATVDARTVPAGDAIPQPQAPLPDQLPRAQALRAAVAAPVLPGAVAVLALLLVLLVCGRRPRLAVSVIAVLAVVVLAFESGLHSVHHLGDDRGASQCSVASATTHLAGTADEPTSVVAIARPTSEPRAVAPSMAPASHPLGLDAGRAPPHLAA